MKKLGILFIPVLCAGILFISCDGNGSEEEPVKYTVTVTDDGNGTAQAYPLVAGQGSDVTIFATPNELCHFVRWNVVSGNVELEDATVTPAVFTMPAGDVEIMTEFANNQSLAKSIQIRGYSMEWEGSFGEINWEYHNWGMINITAISDTEVSVDCFVSSMTARFNIFIPVVSLSGKPYDVVLNHQPSDDTHIEGWIKKKEAETWVGDELVLADIVYECDITITGKSQDKAVYLKISQLDPWMVFAD